MCYSIRELPVKIVCFTIVLFLIGCTPFQNQPLEASRLDYIELSAPQGSGGERTLTMYYDDGMRSESLPGIKRLDTPEYSDDKDEQTIYECDFDNDGILELIVYQEFWFPDLKLVHLGVPDWPTIYEFCDSGGFYVASSANSEYYKEYLDRQLKLLENSGIVMCDEYEFKCASKIADEQQYKEMLAICRLAFAAQGILDGKLIPESEYDKHYYQDVYDYSKCVNLLQ